jgi:hypothetical protein
MQIITPIKDAMIVMRPWISALKLLDARRILTFNESFFTCGEPPLSPGRPVPGRKS